MTRTVGAANTSADLRRFGNANFVVGRIVAIDGNGYALVEFPGNELGPLPARCLQSACDAVATLAGAESRVLLAFDGGDPTLPIILGGLVEAVKPAAVKPKLEPAREVVVDGHSISFTAKEQITLQCGRCSISLSRDGKILIRGEDVLTRASRTNKIKGAAVMIN